MLRRVMLATTLGAFAVGLAGCPCEPPTSTTLSVTLHPQETNMWCWAGSGQMVMHYLGNNVAQCTQANNRFGRTDCPCSQCSNPISNSPCVIGGWPEFDKYGFDFVRTSNTALSWDQLKKEIATESNCGKRPFAFSWHWPGGGGHMMVARGYSTAEGTDYVSVLDPWAPCTGDQKMMTYDYYVASPGHHTHWDDFYRVRKK